MDPKLRYHSVRLDKTLCKGCTNCLMHCPTEAIRVRKGRAHILDERCIDCGECLRVCPYQAKKAIFDKLQDIEPKYKWKIALPPPSLYPRKHRELLRAIVAVRTGISFWRIDLKALDAAYSIAFPRSTPLNVNKKKR